METFFFLILPSYVFPLALFFYSNKRNRYLLTAAFAVTHIANIALIKKGGEDMPMLLQISVTFMFLSFGLLSLFVLRFAWWMLMQVLTAQEKTTEFLDRRKLFSSFSFRWTHFAFIWIFGVIVTLLFLPNLRGVSIAFYVSLWVVGLSLFYIIGKTFRHLKRTPERAIEGEMTYSQESEEEKRK